MLHSDMKPKLRNQEKKLCYVELFLCNKMLKNTLEFIKLQGMEYTLIEYEDIHTWVLCSHK